jgi:hypothetical protein
VAGPPSNPKYAFDPGGSCLGRPGIRVIAKLFGVSPITVQNVDRA